MCMKVSAFLAWCLTIVSGVVHGQECPDLAPYQKVRETVEDLGRIVAPNGVQETYKTRVGGIDQWITTRGQDRANPVVLFVHGGPASPLTPTLWQFQRPLEEYFTMVTYDQRGAGRTYAENDHAAVGKDLRIDQYVEDTIAIAEQVRKRYGKDKLVLMGHSWGTILGMKAALRQPE